MLSKLKVLASGIIEIVKTGVKKAIGVFNLFCVLAFLLLGVITLLSGIILVLKALFALAMSAGLVVNVPLGVVIAAAIYGAVFTYRMLKDTELDDIFDLAKVYLFGGIAATIQLIRMFIAWITKRNAN